MHKVIPSGKKLTILEFGSGRGGLSRYIATKFKNEGILEKMICVNIAENENEYNASKAREEGLGEDIFEVQHSSFD